MSAAPGTDAPDPRPAEQAQPSLFVRAVGWLVGCVDRLFGPLNHRATFDGVEGFIGWLLRYPLLFGQVLLYALIAWGVLGGELGLSDLFWHEQWRSQFFVGVATAWLFGVVLFVNTLLHGPSRLPGRPSDPELTRWGYFTLFPSRNPGVRLVGWRIAGWLLGLMVVIWAGKVVAVALTDGRPWAEWPARGGWFVLGYLAGMTFAYFLSLLDYSLRVREQIADQRWLRAPFEYQNLTVPGAPVAVPVNAIPAAPAPDAEPAAQLDAARNNFRTIQLLHAMALFVGVVAFVLILAVVVVWAGVFDGRSSPAVILSLLLIFATVTAGFLAFRVRSHRTLGVLVVLYLFAANSQYLIRHKSTIPGIDDAKYVRGSELQLTNGEYREKYRFQAPEGGLIGADELLAKFRTNWQNPPKGPKRATKPRLVLIATSGGGIRAAVWTGVVLEGLEQHTPVREHIRIIAGASGGMVGAGAYASRFDQGPLPTEPRDDGSGLLPFAHALARDSLTPVVQTTLLRDFTVNAVLPLRFGTDRGRKLEQAWDENFTTDPRDDEPGPVLKKLPVSPFATPLRQLREKEAACERPSLIFTPMLVEDSKRLFISNLDLRALTEPSANRLGVGANPDPLSLPGMEFFRLFPTATDFRVGTAARLSATFPVVSPAVGLPVYPIRRAVDAGYYDNYGVDALANWLLHHKDAVTEHTSGVLLIQIRALPLEANGQNLHEEPRSSLDVIVGAASAPLEALMNARGGAAYHRNNALLAEVHRTFNREPDRADFFTTVAFESTGAAALSWYLTTPQKRHVVGGFSKVENGEWVLQDGTAATLKAIRAWFGDGGR